MGFLKHLILKVQSMTASGGLYSSSMVGNNSPAGMGHVVYIKEREKNTTKKNEEK